MALQRQTVRMSVDGGLDTKTDDKNVLPTDFLELENIRFTKTKAFIKRYGYMAMTNNILGGGTITAGNALTTFNDELLRYDANSVYSYAESEDKWANKGLTKYAISNEFSVTSNGSRLLRPCHYTLSNLTLYAYEVAGVASSDVQLRVIDNNTGSVLATNTITSAANPMVLGIYGTFFIFYYDSGAIKFRTVNFGAPSTVSAATPVLTVATNSYDVCQIGTRSYVVGPATTGLTVAWVNPDSTIAGPVSVADASSYTRVAISACQNTNVQMTYGNSSSGALKTILYLADLTAPVYSAVTLEASTTVDSITSIQDPTNVNASKIFAGIAVDPYTLKRYTVSSAGSITFSGTCINQAALQSRAAVFDNKVYFAVSKDASYLESGPVYTPFRTYFLANEDGNLLNKFGLDAGVFRSGETLPNLNIENTNELCFAGAIAAAIQANLSAPAVTVPTTVKKFCSNFSSNSNYFDSQLGNNLHIAGGILKMYDGDKVVEHNFLETPPAPVFVSDTGSGAVLTDGTYQYIAVFRWNDKWGQVHRSATSLPLTYVVSGGPKKPTIRVFTLTLTQKTNVEIEVYRTEANGTIFYKHQYDFADIINNDPSVESITFVDTLSDANLIKNEVLYTTGGVLDNEPAESNIQLVTYHSRLFVLLSDYYTIQYTKRRSANEPAEFAAEFQITLDQRGGKGVALAVMDDNLIIFKEQAIFAMNGQGPNNLGLDDDFRPPTLITTDAGLQDPNSVVVTPVGLMFKSSKGIYLLDRNLAVRYIGASVEGFNNLTISSATLLPNTNEIRFTTNSETQLFYDYYHDKWGTDANINAVDAVLFDGIYHYLRANGELMAETPNLYSDNGSYIPVRITSSWMQFAGIQGFERFYEMLLLGTYKSPHGLKVKFAYDYDPTYDNEATIPAGTLLSNPTYGNGFYGSDVEGGNYPLYQFRIFPSRQKCESFKFSITDFKTDNNGEALQLSNFLAEVGIKSGAYKKNANQSFGAQ